MNRLSCWVGWPSITFLRAAKSSHFRCKVCCPVLTFSCVFLDSAIETHALSTLQYVSHSRDSAVVRLFARTSGEEKCRLLSGLRWHLWLINTSYSALTRYPVCLWLPFLLYYHASCDKTWGQLVQTRVHPACVLLVCSVPAQEGRSL